MFNKIQTVGPVGQFVQNTGAATPPPLGFWDSVGRLFTEPNEVMQEKMGDTVYNFIHPFLDILGVIAYPVASVVIAVAGIMYILQMREKAVTWLTKTSIYYVLIQLLPLLTRTLISMIVAY